MADLASQKENIKEYVLIINPLVEDNDFLDFVIDSVVERALIYMNRLQLDNQDVTEFYGSNIVPAVLPAELERTLAQVVVGAYRTTEASSTSGKQASQLSDNGQSITYSTEMAIFINGDESDIFSSSLRLLDKYKLPTIVGNYYSV